MILLFSWLSKRRDDNYIERFDCFAVVVVKKIGTGEDGTEATRLVL